MANCWGGFSFFQMACILMLLVGIPFLIALIVIYAVYGFGDHESGSCAVFCCYLEGGLNWFTTTHKAETLKEYDVVIEDYTSPSALPVRSLDFPTEEGMVLEVENPSIGALLENVYADDGNEVIFKCAVAIIDEEWALTVDDCLSDGNLSVRVGSSYWSKGGSVQEVKDIIYLRKNRRKPSLVLIRFEKSEEVLSLQIGKLSNIYLKSYFWLDSVKNSLLKRHKFDRLKSADVEFLQKDDCLGYKKSKHVSCYISRKSDFCGRRNAPIIDLYDRLVGLHLETVCEEKKKYSIVFYVNIADFNSTINSVI